MSGFLNELTSTQLNDNWELERIEVELMYQVGPDHSEQVIGVKKGFVSDGTSLLRWLRPFLPRRGRYERAGFLHDYLYNLILEGTPHPLAHTRDIADFIFLRAMKDLGVNWWVRTIMWLAVRIGGANRFLRRLVGLPEWNPKKPEPIKPVG